MTGNETNREELRGLLQLLDQLQIHLDDEEAPLEPDLAAARDRILAQHFPAPTVADSTTRTEAQVDREFRAIVKTYLSGLDRELLMARSAGLLLPTHDLHVPELVAAGYSANVELEIDVADTATVIVLLQQVADDSARLRVVGTLSSGEHRWAMFSGEHVAVLRDIPLNEIGNLSLTFERLST